MLAIGKVAKCKKGLTGLVLRVSKVKNIMMYYGVCIDSGRIGQSWQSALPKWIGTFDDWVKIRHAEIMAAEQVAKASYSRNHVCSTRNLFI